MPFMIRETVAIETPACLATAVIEAGLGLLPGNWGSGAFVMLALIVSQDPRFDHPRETV